MKVIGETIWLREEEPFITQIKTYTLANFIKIEPMGMELTSTRMARDMRACGKMTNKTVRE